MLDFFLEILDKVKQICYTNSRMSGETQNLSLENMCTKNSVLIKRLRAIQKRDHLSDTRFAEKLNIHRIHWSRIKHGQQRPGTKLVSNAFKAYPDELYDIDLTTIFCPAKSPTISSKPLRSAGGHSHSSVTDRNGHAIYVMSTLKRAILSLLTRGYKKLIKSSTFSPFKQG